MKNTPTLEAFPPQPPSSFPTSPKPRSLVGLVLTRTGLQLSILSAASHHRERGGGSTAPAEKKGGKARPASTHPRHRFPPHRHTHTTFFPSPPQRSPFILRALPTAQASLPARRSGSPPPAPIPPACGPPSPAARQAEGGTRRVRRPLPFGSVQPPSSQLPSSSAFSAIKAHRPP